jgi:hypothetical protein
VEFADWKSTMTLRWQDYIEERKDVMLGSLLKNPVESGLYEKRA